MKSLSITLAVWLFPAVTAHATVKTAKVILPGHTKPVEIQYVVQAGNAIFQDDIDLGPEAQLIRPWRGYAWSSRLSSGVPRSIQSSVRSGDWVRWPGNVVPYVISAPASLAIVVRDAITRWNVRTNVEFRPANASDRDVAYFINDESIPGKGRSSVGRVGGVQWIQLKSDAPERTVIHEMGHAVGLYHEQSRLDRDAFVEVLWHNIEPGREGNFSKHIDSIDEGPYDYRSVIHYRFDLFGRVDPSTGKRLTTLRSLTRTPIDPMEELSPGDIAALDRIYPPRDVSCDDRIPVLFRDHGLTGTAVSLESSIPNLASKAMNDSASSLCVPSGWTVTLYEHKDYNRGTHVPPARSRTIRGPVTIRDLGAASPDGKTWGDMISSVQVAGAAANPIPPECAAQPVIFEHDHYTGRRFTLPTSTVDLHQSSIQLGDKVSSACVPDGWTVRVYVDDEYGGDYLELPGPWAEPDLRLEAFDGLNWGDEISSVQVTGPNGMNMPESCSTFPQLFEDDNYRGRSFEMRWEARNLHQNEFGDEASSVCVPAGWKVELFENMSFSGLKRELRGPASIADLRSSGWGDRISSFTVEAPTRSYGIGCSEPVLYEHDSYRGRKFQLTRNFRDFHSADFGDSASSMCVPGGWSITLFEHANFAGRSMTVHGPKSSGDLAKEAPDLQDWGDRISSVKVEAPPGTPSTFPCQVPTLYKDANHWGTDLPFSSSLPNLSQQNFDDTASSICVPAGLSITVYQDANYKGPSRRIDGPWELFNLEREVLSFNTHWGDRISSVRVH